MPLGSAEYREGALFRLREARMLREAEEWSGAIYLAGRAIEGLFRGLLWSAGTKQEVGHDLRDLLIRVRQLGLAADQMDEIAEAVSEVAAVWRNDHRFRGAAAMMRHLQKIGRDKFVGGRKVRGDPLKANALYFLENAEVVIHRGEIVWQRKLSKKK